MVSWGTDSFSGMTDYIKSNFPSHEKFLIGHSVGALILGLNPDSSQFKKLAFVGSQNAYIGHLDWPVNIFGLLGFGLMQPVTTALLGYFPASKFNLGRDLPSGVGFDWRSLVIKRKSTGLLLEKAGFDYAKNLSQKVLVVRAEDDSWLTEKGVSTLLREVYPNLKPVRSVKLVSESPKGNIGHVNYFRSYNSVLWKEILDFFENE